MEKILEIKNLLKIYPNGKIANKHVSVDIENNTIHAIVGENGAGKSTLMNIVFGAVKPTDGQIFFKGKQISLTSPKDAIQIGIGMVHQHLMLAPELTVAENLMLGIEPKKKGIFLDYASMMKTTKEVSERYGMKIPIKGKVQNLPIGIRQRIEILKALIRNAEVLILDEPTSVLTPQEVEHLFATLRQLKQNGKTVLFISHKLNEVKAISDRITVMKDATVVTTRNAEDLDEHDIAKLMVGRDIRIERLPASESIGETLLSVDNLTCCSEDGTPTLSDISFELRRGEILGVAGVEGNGQSELSRVLTGLLPAVKGTIRYKGKEMLGQTPRQIREAGFCHIPEDRMDNGVGGQISIEENLIADRYYTKTFSKGPFILSKQVRSHAEELIHRFNISAQSPSIPVISLSGGNIQKTVVARELTSSFDLLIAAQPTRGVDIGSEEMIHELLKTVRDDGKAVFLISADLDEILELSDRIIVLYEGKIVGHFKNTPELTDKDLGSYMLGIKKEMHAHGKVSAEAFHTH